MKVVFVVNTIDKAGRDTISTKQIVELLFFDVVGYFVLLHSKIVAPEI